MNPFRDYGTKRSRLRGAWVFNNPILNASLFIVAMLFSPDIKSSQDPPVLLRFGMVNPPLLSRRCLTNQIPLVRRRCSRTDCAMNSSSPGTVSLSDKRKPPYCHIHLVITSFRLVYFSPCRTISPHPPNRRPRRPHRCKLPAA